MYIGCVARAPVVASSRRPGPVFLRGDVIVDSGVVLPHRFRALARSVTTVESNRIVGRCAPLRAAASSSSHMVALDNRR
jgi:hypothetical protein